MQKYKIVLVSLASFLKVDFHLMNKVVHNNAYNPFIEGDFN